MTKKFYITFLILFFATFIIGACSKAEVYIDASKQSTYSTSGKTVTRAEKKRIKREQITKQIVAKEAQIKNIKKSKNLRASQKRAIIKGLERDLKKLSDEYSKI